MIVLFTNNANTTLSGSISNVQTTLNVAPGTGVEFPTPVLGSSYFVISMWDQLTQTQTEIMWVTQKVGDTFTVLRGQETTNARTWSAGDLVNHELTAGQMGVMVQEGDLSSPAPSSLIYSGIDIGGVNILVVPSLTPSLSALVFGMTFDIMIAQTNTGASTLSVMGLPSAPVVRIDGTALVDGNLTGGEMMKMWWDGVKFVTPIQNIPVVIPNTTFYCDPAGSDDNDGLTPHTPFCTLQGAMNAICSRYTSQQTVTLSCVHGTYHGGCKPPGPFICNWNIVGDDTNPGSCTCDARSTPTIADGRCFHCPGGTNINCHGFTCLSFQENHYCENGGQLNIANCIHTPPTSENNHCVNACKGGQIKCTGVHTFNGSTSCPSHFHAETGGCISIGHQDSITSDDCTVAYQGSPNFTQGCATTTGTGTINCVAANVTFTGSSSVTGKRHQCDTGGGIFGTGGNNNFFPGSLAGTVDSSSFSWFK
jgi:hypothetical protein